MAPGGGTDDSREAADGAGEDEAAARTAPGGQGCGTDGSGEGEAAVARLIWRGR